MDEKAPFNSLEGLCKWASNIGYIGVQIPTLNKSIIYLDDILNITDIEQIDKTEQPDKVERIGLKSKSVGE